MNNNKSRARRSERRRNKENGEIERRKDDCHANGSYVVVFVAGGLLIHQNKSAVLAQRVDG